MTATLALEIASPSPHGDEVTETPRRSRSRVRRSAPGPAGAAGSDGRPSALRIRPVPRSEPLTDDERIAGLAGVPLAPLVARRLPPDLATGVRVRRAPGERGTSGGPGAAAPAGTAGAARPGSSSRPRPAGPPGGGDDGGTGGRGLPAAPTVLRTPEVVMALVATPLHASPPASRARSGSAPRRRPVSDDRPAGTHPPEAAPPPGGSPVLSMVAAPGLGLAPADTPAPVDSTELRLAARRLLGTCVEVLEGFRPLAQLRPYCAPERFDAIVNRLLRPICAGRGYGATRSSLIAGREASARPGRPVRVRPEDRLLIRRVQICTLMDEVAELAVVISRRDRVWAMTVRLERSRGRWLCMHLEVL